MIGLDRLMGRKGVVAAGQFASDGRVIRAVGGLSPGEMEAVALTCANVEKHAWVAATELRDSTGLKWGNLNGWILWAGDLALCVSGDTGVFVEAAKADFNQLLVDLFGPPAGEHPTLDIATAVFEPRMAKKAKIKAKKAQPTVKYDDYSLNAKGPHKPARPLMFLKDKDGNGWLCDKGIDPELNLEAQGCWRCEDMAFPMGI